MHLEIRGGDFDSTARGGLLESGWRRQDGQFTHLTARGDTRPREDWLDYQHWDPSRGEYGPVRDFYAYNGGDLRAENEVADVGIEARLMRE